MTAKSFSSYHQTLVKRTVLGILLTGVVVAIAALWPLSKQLTTHLEQVNYAHASAQSVAIQNHIGRYQDIAKQIASRSEIRQAFVRFSNNEITLSELGEYSTPRLVDAYQATAGLEALLRVTTDNEMVVVLSDKLDVLDLDAATLNRIKAQGAYVTNLPYNGDLLSVLAISEPILAANGNEASRVIGYDVLLFQLAPVLNTVTSFNRFGSEARFYLLNQELNLVAHVDADIRQEHIGLVDIQDSSLANLVITPGIFRGDDSGQRFVYFYVPFERSNWGLMVRSSTTQVYATLVSEISWVVLAIFAMILVGVTFVHFTTKPVIRELADKSARLAKSNKELRLAGMVFEKTHEAIMVTDMQLKIVRANHALAETLKIPQEQLIGKALDDILARDRIKDDTEQQITIAIQLHDVWQGELWYLDAEGKAIPALQTISSVRNKAGEIEQLIHIFNDITHEKNAENEIKKKANTDALTGLPNRAGLLLMLDHAIYQAQLQNKHLAVLFVDLDKFKPVNDTHGHDVGDQLLAAIGPRLREHLRSSDTIARIGGDEFVVLLSEVTTADSAMKIANGIVTQMNQPFHVAGLDIQIGASVGVAVFPEHGTGRHELLNNADQAMYLAKQNGRNQACLAAPSSAKKKSLNA
ncbi:MAG: diguanylate cyclase [Idiomarina sp.]|nr:diguanylate cyclase [Idiomarina sp.]